MSRELSSAAENGVGIGRRRARRADHAAARPRRLPAGATAADIAAAFAYAGARGIRVVNASLEPRGSSIAVRTAIRDLPRHPVRRRRGQRGRGRRPRDPRYPCALDEPNVLCVGASDAARSPCAAVSNYGATQRRPLRARRRHPVDLARGSASSTSTTAPSTATDLDGPPASPHARASAALVASRQPGWSAAQIKAALLAGADPRARARGPRADRRPAQRRRGRSGSPRRTPAPSPAGRSPGPRARRHGRRPGRRPPRVSRSALAATPRDLPAHAGAAARAATLSFR